jgi:hypothetical protein
LMSFSEHYSHVNVGKFDICRQIDEYTHLIASIKAQIKLVSVRFTRYSIDAVDYR